MSPVIERRPGFLNFPPVIKFLLIANIVIFFLTEAFGTLTYQGQGQLGELAMRYLALNPMEDGFLPWQLISYQFMHANFMHLLFNMFALWMFGVEIENLWGSRKFGTYYILCGIAAGILHLVVVPILDLPPAVTLGASGSIMGILLAFGMTFPTRPVLMFPIFFPIPAKYFVMIYAALDLVQGLFATGSNVAHFAHLGGALGGILLIKFGEPLFRWIDGIGGSSGTPRGGFTREASPLNIVHQDSDTRSNAPERQAPVALHRIPSSQTPTRFVVDGEAVTQETIDEILDKISQFGPHSISAKEKRILYEVSKQM